MLVSGGPVFSVEPLAPDFSRINPASGFKRIFSRKAMLTYLMHIVRLSVLTAVFAFILVGGWSAMMRAPVCGFGCAAETLDSVVLPMVIGAVAVMAGFDCLVKRFSFLHGQRMTRTEYKRELKDQMGDPHLRRALRGERRQMMIAPIGARQATLVVTGGPAVAVGIRYVEGETPAPRRPSKRSMPASPRWSARFGSATT